MMAYLNLATEWQLGNDDSRNQARQLVLLACLDLAMIIVGYCILVLLISTS
jgi:hypothetical protein